MSEAIAMAKATEDELELFVREHARLAYRIAYSVLRNHQDAEDATQEIFLRVLAHRKKIAHLHDPRAWLARIAWRMAIGRRRKITEVAMDQIAESAVELRSRMISADAAVLGNEMTEILEKLIEKLPVKLRNPLMLSTLEELSPAQIAVVLGVNEAAARSRIFRARQMLRDKLAALLGEEHGI